MKAATYIKKNSGKVLEIVELAVPVPKDNEVLIRVRATSINPLDWRMKSQTPGVDAAGQVEGIGKSVSQFKPGDAVFGLCKHAFAEYASARESALTLKPDALTFEQAASIPIAGLTALQGLRKIGQLEPGRRVLINGAAGGVGTFAVQIAKVLGAHVTAVCSGGNVEQTLALGADRVVDYTLIDFTTENERYDLILDNVGNRPLSAMRQVLAPRGRCVLIGAPKEFLAVFTRVLKSFAWSPFLRQKFVFFIAKSNQDDLTFLGQLMASGRIKAAIGRLFPLTQLTEAIAYVETGHARGKVVIQL